MNKVVEIERRVPYPVERVFAAWLKPEKFSQWFLPDPGVKLGKVELDPIVGGRFLIEMIVGSETLPHTGVYKTIIPNEKIAFTWRSSMTGDSETLVEVSFQGQNGQTLLTLRHSGLDSPQSREAHGSGWAHIIAGIEPFLSRQEPHE